MQNIDNFINKLEIKIKELFKKDETGHDLEHLKRVLNNALYLQKKEGGDVVVVAISAFIHDVHRIMSSDGKYVSPKQSLPVINKLIQDLDITEEQKQHILYAIEHHEEYAFGKEKVSVTDIESKILQDADNLDALGAVGIARCFKYGIAHNMKDYDASIPFYRNEYDESNAEETTIHHMYNKLLRLGEYMNTKTARKLAEPKTKLIKDFIDIYVKEVTGKFDF